MLAKRLFYLLVACCLLVLLAGLGGHVTAQGGSASLVLKFPVVRDFGGVQGKVLYIGRNLSESMPLRFAVDRVEAVAGFFPSGRRVTVFCAGSRLGSAVADDGLLSVPVSSLPVDGALEVVESEQELPVSGVCVKVKSTGGVLRVAGSTSVAWSPPPGTVRMLRAHVKADVYYGSGSSVSVSGWDGVSWRTLFSVRDRAVRDLWVDIPPGITRLMTSSTIDPLFGGGTWVDVPEVEVEVQFVEDVVLPPGDPGVIVQERVTQVPTDGVPYLQALSHGADLWSNVWSLPAGAVRLLRVLLEGQSERDWDYGYLYGWDGASWHLIAKRSGVYSEWVTVPPGITRLMVRLVTDGSVLESPKTYIHVRAAEVEWGSSLASKTVLTGGVLKAVGCTTAPWSAPPGTVRMLRAHVKADVYYGSGSSVSVSGWDGVSWRTLFSVRDRAVRDLWVDIPPGITRLMTSSTIDPLFGGGTWVDVPEVVVEEVSSP